MSSETLPFWLWIIYYLIMFMTLVAAIRSLFQKKMIMFSFIVSLYTVSIPIISLGSSIGRAEGLNEFSHFFQELQHNSPWSLFVMIGYLCILLWWALLFIKINQKKITTSR
ncbi:hypothetical protein [Brevibacillus sp. NRS-1366]|uniref:hypothetical protein n=1 Tax=Brevibacillus sp. NRS-1366 TaxID=3233899 RepID=UPI003D1D3447